MRRSFHIGNINNELVISETQDGYGVIVAGVCLDADEWQELCELQYTIKCKQKPQQIEETE